MRWDSFRWGRLALRANYLPLFLCVSAALFWLGWRRRSWRQIALAGACAGLLPYTYIAARAVPLLFLSFGLTFLVPPGQAGRERARDALPRIMLFLGAAGLVAAPMLFHYVLHPEDFSSRTQQVWLFEQGGDPTDWAAALLGNVREQLSILGLREQGPWSSNSFAFLILHRFEAIFFWVGVGIALLRWGGNPAYRLLLLWLVCMFLPSLLSVPVEPGEAGTQRMVGGGTGHLPARGRRSLGDGGGKCWAFRSWRPGPGALVGRRRGRRYVA